MFNLGNKKEQEVEVEEPTYSVIIHFTRNRDYVYFIKDNTVFSNGDGSIFFEDEDEMNVEINGDYVYRNDFETKGKAEDFVHNYRLENPIYINF